VAADSQLRAGGGFTAAGKRWQGLATRMRGVSPAAIVPNIGLQIPMITADTATTTEMTMLASENPGFGS